MRGLGGPRSQRGLLRWCRIVDIALGLGRGIALLRRPAAELRNALL